MAAKKPEKPSAKKGASSDKNKKAAPAPVKGSVSTKSAAAAKGSTSKKAPAPAPAKPTKATPAKAAPAKAAPVKATPAKAAPARPAPAPAPAAKAAPASAPAAAKAPVKGPITPLKRSTKVAAKDLYSPATGTATSEPFSAKELEKFRAMIQDLRMESIEELESLTEQLREMTASEVGEENSAYSLHMAEQGTDAMEREKTFLQAQRTNDYIKKLDETLRRAQDGTFGLCRICGLRLDSKRLLAVPVTQVCTVYKNTSKPCEPGRIRIQELGLDEDDMVK